MSKRPENGVQFSYPSGLAVSFDPSAFDDAIRSQGVQLVHYRAMKCPVGLIDRYDSRRPHDDHSGCSNGMIYTKAGTITCLFTGASEEMKQNDVGLLDGSTVQVTAPRFYDDSTEEVQIQYFDRLYLAEEAVTVPHFQLAEAHISGKEKLSFPVVKVMDIMDAAGRRYSPGDYSVGDGMIIWTGSGPGFDAERNKGIIFACRFTYRPYFYVSRVIHQVRVAQVDTALERITMRMPQQFLLSREYVFEKSDNDDEAQPDSGDPQEKARQVRGPRSGSFGPR